MGIHKNTIQKLVALICLFVMFSVWSHGFVGFFVSTEQVVYCAISEVFMRTQCPSRDKPLERANFNSTVFQSLLQARDRIQTDLNFLMSADLLSTNAINSLMPVVITLFFA